MDSLDQVKSLDWWGEEVVVVPLEGGITNHNYLAHRISNVAEKFVVRLGSDIPVHHISRANEIAAGKAACKAGISPAIRHCQPGVLIIDYIAGQTLQPADVANDHMLERLVPVIKSCHRDVPQHLCGSGMAFWVFHVFRDYAATLRSGSSVHTDKLPELLAASALLEPAAGPFDIVFGHNDLLSANLLDDGEKIWLIDWEYAGFNTPLFDLGGLASNNQLNESQERWLLSAYYERDVGDELWRRYQAMKVASLLRELMWSMVSEIHSTVDFNYSAYTEENLTRFNSAYLAFREHYL